MTHVDGDVTPDALDKAGRCANRFGSALTNGFGRLDGTILAVVPPGLQTCAQPNGTHLVVQVTMNGAAYRMVINVDSDISMREIDAPLAGPAWGDGWHLDAPLDYVTTLNVHAAEFTKPDSRVAFITDQLALGAPVSIYGTDEGYPDSAHLVHRRVSNGDGAIVISPDTAPHYILFRFDTQSF